ncbi:oxidoreductase, partial [Vibrio parahaemolyticus]|nr:oxidoreductase [Vibrio parahaemolyticus]
IRLGTDNPVPAAQAVQNIALIEMALESSKTGKTIQVKP